MKKLNIKIFFAWFDFWIGFYWDRDDRILYVCPIPTIVFKFWREPEPFVDPFPREIRTVLFESEFAGQTMRAMVPASVRMLEDPIANQWIDKSARRTFGDLVASKLTIKRIGVKDFPDFE